MLSAVTLSESALMVRENLIEVTINSLFINLRKNGKDTNGMIIFDIKSDLFLRMSIMSTFFNYEGNIEMNSEFLSL